MKAKFSRRLPSRAPHAGSSWSVSPSASCSRAWSVLRSSG